MTPSYRPPGDAPVSAGSDRQAELAVRLLEGAQPIATRLLESVDKDTEMRAELGRQYLELARQTLEQAHAERADRSAARTRAQLYALVIALAGFGLAGYAFRLGHPTAAAAVAGAGLAGIVTAMLKSSWHREDDDLDVE